VTAPDRLRQELRGLAVGRLLERCGRLRRSGSGGADELATGLVLRSLAGRVEAATGEAAELEREILVHVQALAPRLLEEPGIGPIVAAQLLVAWSHRGRVRSEAAFARLAGVAPLPASSGQTIRQRLSRGGDRQLNRALHTIVLHRRRPTPRPGTTSRGVPSRARAAARPPACSSVTSHATSTGYCRTRSRFGLTGHRSFIPEHWPRLSLIPPEGVDAEATSSVAPLVRDGQSGQGAAAITARA
jgi:transposase